MTADFAAGCAKLWVDHGVAAGEFDLHIVDDCVHLRDGVVVCLEFLARQLHWDAAGGVKFVGDDLQFDE